MFRNFDRIKILGIAFLIAGVLIVFLHKYPSNWRYNVLISHFYANVSTEFISTSITILLINYLYDIKERRALKLRLLRELGSETKGFSSRAVKELRENGWLSDGSLKNLDLSHANLSNLDFSDAVLEGINFENANLTNSKFNNSKLTNSNFLKTNLEKANLDSCTIINSTFHSATLTECILSNSEIKDSDFMNSNLELTEMINVKFNDCKLEEVSLNFTNLSRSKIVKCDLLRADLQSANIHMAKFERCDLSGIKNWTELANRDKDSFLASKNMPEDFMNQINK